MKRGIIYTLVAIILLVLCIISIKSYFLSGMNIKPVNFNISAIAIISSIVAIISGINGIIIGLANFRLTKLNSIKEYFEKGDTREFIECRKRIYESDKRNISEEDGAVVCSFFHFWGMMVKKGYLPIWVFESSSGISIVRLYEKLTDFITKKRKINPKYAEYFSWLVKKIRKKYKIPLIENYYSIDLKSKSKEETNKVSHVKNKKG